MTRTDPAANGSAMAKLKIGETQKRFMEYDLGGDSITRGCGSAVPDVRQNPLEIAAEDQFDIGRRILPPDQPSRQFEDFP